MLPSLLAWTGALLSCLLCLPQAYRTVRARRLTGVAASTYWLTLANAVVWAGWALSAGQPAVAVPALVNGPASVLILIRLRQTRDRPPTGNAPDNRRRRYSASRTSVAARSPERTAPSMYPFQYVDVSAPAQWTRANGSRIAAPKSTVVPVPATAVGPPSVHCSLVQSCSK